MLPDALFSYRLIPNKDEFNSLKEKFKGANMPDNADEVLLAQLKIIRARFGDEAVKDSKVLAAILAAEVPEHKDRIDAFVAMLNGAPEPAPSLRPVHVEAAEPVTESKPELESMPPAIMPAEIKTPRTVDPDPVPTNLQGASRSRLYLAAAVVVLLLIVGGAVAFHASQTSAQPPSISISNGAPAAPRPATSHAGEKLVDNFDTGPPNQMFSGVLALGAGDLWQGAVEQGAYQVTGTSQDHTSYLPVIPPLHDTTSNVSVPVNGIEADVYVDGKFPDSAVGLIFDASPTGAYWFLVTKDGHVGIISVNYGQNGTSFGSNQTTQISPAKNGWYHLTVRLNGDTNEFLVNNQSVGSQSDSSIQGINAGLVVMGAGVFKFRQVVRTLG